VRPGHGSYGALPRGEHGRPARRLHSEIFAADRALELVAEGMPFRDAYRKVGAELATLKEATDGCDKEEDLDGGPGNLRLDVSHKALEIFDPGSKPRSAIRVREFHPWRDPKWSSSRSNARSIRESLIDLSIRLDPEQNRP